ncbi:D-alanyl-D-alanine carboxypeptidase family protein [Natranaerobius thermophilus]|uniref:serine-type D-Ala-D-Ala carboxypeptidase n=1 Tax=Natranaerobius thermophilus (strain ATCC BAA-1301 / DSM 18059 / JW/NM-WN-LF) TaxID=457570 RepID=B2A1Z0_NATTJ|nr:D-alanyl-D-alanine carboxypeptidase family protein [Natranaerobius thermophilus]ACB84795.1 Serine-type D-Ala-D-Ala carboxypeptidase [Natranaerobius thermophilus JW/NM-WN-LF]
MKFNNIYIIIPLLFLMIVNPLLSPSVSAEEFDFDAESVILIEAETGRTIYENNAEKSWPPASLTKVMTLVIGLEALNEGELELEETTRVSAKANQTGGSQMFLRENQEVTIEDLLTGIAVVSANDGCVALAEHMEGSVNNFVNRMNEKAEEIGLENTNFKDPHGLASDGQYMNARDVARLSQYAVNETPKILELESITGFQFNIESTQYNRNLMLPDHPQTTRYSYEGTDGLKTGQIEEAGYNFVGTAQRDDMRLIAVVLGAEEQTERFNITRQLFDHGFSEYQKIKLFDEGDELEQVDVKDGSERQTMAISETEANVTTKFDNDQELEFVFQPKDEELRAPIQKGEYLGELLVIEDGKEIASIPGIAQDEVEELGFFGRIARTISDAISNTFESIKDSIVDFIFGDD